jgi:lipoyl(octanoyl) transferase
LNWRFIPYAEFDGASNMAIDVGLLERAESCLSRIAGHGRTEGAEFYPPVLRLYGFSPPCLSIGFSQALPEDVTSRVRARGFEIVRRPTGGRAVLHFKDLTYSFVAAEKGEGDLGILEASVSAAYRQICAGLSEAFLLLGFAVELGPAQAAYRHLVDCFAATTNADLHFQGCKLAGSAQLRRRGAVLQHGSIPLSLDQELVSELLAGAQVGRVERKTDHHANLFEILKRSVSFAELNQAMKTGFERAFSVEFEESELSSEELAQAGKRKSEFSCR